MNRNPFKEILQYYTRWKATKAICNWLIFIFILIIISSVAVFIIPTSTFSQLYVFRAYYWEFKEMFPRYYLPAYAVIKLISIGILGLMILFYKYYRHTFFNKFSYQSSNHYFSNFKFHIYNALSSLSIFLIAYYGIQWITIADEKQMFIWQLLLSRTFLLIFFLQIANAVYHQWEQAKTTFKGFFLEKSTPYTLAIFRILFFGLLVTHYLEFTKYRAFWTELDEKVPLPYMGWFINNFDIGSSSYQFIGILGIVTAIFIVLGVGSRTMLLINIPLSFIITATPNFYGKLSHNQIFIWISWIMAFSRCYDVWSIDAWWKKKRGNAFDITPKAVYTIPIRIVWLHFGIIYFFAGVYKLWDCGFDWALSESMVNQIQLEWVQQYDWLPFIRVDHYPMLVCFGGLMVILFELFHPFLLFNHKTRWLAVFGALSLHQSAGYFMKIGFENLQKLHVVFVNWDFVLSKLKLIKNSKQNFHSRTEKIKTILYVGLMIFALNLLCGILAIHSYPFSSYPSYSAIVPSTVELLHFEVFDADGDEIDVLVTAQKVGFRRENYTGFEDRIIEKWKVGEDVNESILEYWKIWQLNIQALENIKELKVYYHKTAIKPEERKNYLANELIFQKTLK